MERWTRRVHSLLQTIFRNTLNANHKTNLFAFLKPDSFLLNSFKQVLVVGLALQQRGGAVKVERGGADLGVVCALAPQPLDAPVAAIEMPRKIACQTRPVARFEAGKIITNVDALHGAAGRLAALAISEDAATVRAL